MEEDFIQALRVPPNTSVWCFTITRKPNDFGGSTMKKYVSLLIAVILLALMLVGCGNEVSAPSGSYTASVLGTGTELVFVEDSVTVNYTVGDYVVASQNGTYSLNESGNQITLAFDFSDEIKEELPENITSLNGTFSYSGEKNYIKIGAVYYYNNKDNEEVATPAVEFESITLALPDEYEISYEITEGGTVSRTYAMSIINTSRGVYLELGDTGEKYVFEKLESGKYIEYHYSAITKRYEAIALTEAVQKQIDAGIITIDSVAVEKAAIDAYATRVTGFFDIYYTVADSIIYQGEENVNGVVCQKYTAAYNGVSGDQVIELWIDASNGLCMKQVYYYDTLIGNGLSKSVECAIIKAEDITLPEYK